MECSAKFPKFDKHVLEVTWRRNSLQTTSPFDTVIESKKL